jgi:hypothetical protein
MHNKTDLENSRARLFRTSQGGSVNHVDPAVSSGSSPGNRKRTRTDFFLFSDIPNPTIYLLTPFSKSACAWIAEHISDDAMWFGSSLVIEHRYCSALLAQIERDGLAVCRG